MARKPATATAWAPASPNTPTTSRAFRSSMSSRAAGRMATAAQAAFRVLVVDDDPDMAGFLARLLVKQGLQADIVSDGHAALERIAAAPPALVLLDAQM